jgi:hypothetical protein
MLSEKEISVIAIATNAQHLLWIFTKTKLQSVQNDFVTLFVQEIIFNATKPFHT